MVERKEPTLTTSSSSSDHHEPREYRSAASPINGNRRASRDEPSAPEVVTKSSSWTGLILLLALAALGLAGFAFVQLMEAQKQLISADNRLLELEKRLELTGDEANQSLTALSAKLKWADDEIRKLWGVSNDRNRKAIDANKANIDALIKELRTVKASATSAKQLADSHAKALSKLQADSSSARELAQQAVTDAEVIQAELSAIATQAARSEKAVANLQTGLVNRVKANEEAIRAIDAYRQSVNRDLQMLKQRLNQAP